MSGSSKRTETPPPFLPPRRPSSTPERTKKESSRQSSSTNEISAHETPPTFLPPRRPSSMQQLPRQQSHERQTAGLETPRVTVTSPPVSRAGSRSVSRPSSLQSRLSRPSSLRSAADTECEVASAPGSERSRSEQQRGPSSSMADRVPRNPRLDTIQSEGQLGGEISPRALRRPPVLRHSSLWMNESVVPEDSIVLEDTTDSEDSPVPARPRPARLSSTHSEPPRPHSHPPAKPKVHGHNTDALPLAARHETLRRALEARDPYRLPPLMFDLSPLASATLQPRPRASLTRLSSLDNILSYHEEKAEWKRTSSVLHQKLSDVALAGDLDGALTAEPMEDSLPSVACSEKPEVIESGTETPMSLKKVSLKKEKESKFRHSVGEIGFCFTIAMTQFLAEYLITGFAVELPRIFYNKVYLGPTTLSTFWPASLLSLILSATLLIFARLSDMYGGYPSFMFGVIWLTIWTLIPGFCKSLLMIDVSRAMQGLAIAALMPSTFTMLGSFYKEGRRKNLIIGLYSGCAPVGFFVGFLAAGGLPADKPEWYFWIASAISFVTTITAFLTIPHDKTDRKGLRLSMDRAGSFLITAGLILLAYALAVEPYANEFDKARTGFSYPTVYAPFCSGVVCLALAVWVEGWLAKCPLLPFEFFRPKSVKAFCFAALCFYASYGAWLYNSADFFQSATGVTKHEYGLQGIHLAVWYAPTAIGGLVLCGISGAIFHIVPTKVVLLFSGLAWIAAPLFLALCALPLNYWAFVMPSMVCATIGIDLTFTISIIFLSAVQPQRYQGLCGAVCSILVNLAMSFSLPISEIISIKAQNSVWPSDMATLSLAEMNAAANHALNWGYRAAFFYGAASASLGFVVCVLWVHISRSVMGGTGPVDEEAQRDTSDSCSMMGGAGPVDEEGQRETSDSCSMMGGAGPLDEDGHRGISSEASTLVDEDRVRQAQDEETPIQSAEFTR